MGSNLAVIPLKEVTVPEIVINLGEQAVITKAGTSALALANAFSVDSDEMMREAQTEMAGWKRQASSIEDWRKGITRPIDDAKVAVMDFVRPGMDGLAEAERVLKAKCVAWERSERERIAREQREREEAARREQERLMAEAREKDRRASEEAAAAAAARQAAQRTHDAKERERLEAEARHNEGAAAQLRESAATDVAIAQVIPPAPTEQRASVKGMSFRGTVEVSVQDKTAVLAWIAANPTFAYLVDVDLQKVKKLATDMGAAFPIPGFSITRDIAAASRTK